MSNAKKEKNKFVFDKLYEQKDKVKNSVGKPIEW